jgi:hypothetical protein
MDCSGFIAKAEALPYADLGLWAVFGRQDVF